MIKYFRKVRLLFLENGKLNKYLLYAIGEILLVVIGILIALNINNWNTSRHERNVEKEYLLSMLTDLEMDRNILEEKIEFGTVPIAYNDSLFQELQKKPLQGREERIYHFLLLYTNSIDISYHDRTISQLKNSGGFQLVRNRIVSDAIVDYDIFMRNLINKIESSKTSNLINNDNLINFNIYELYKVQHLRDKALMYKDEIDQVGYPADLKLISYDDDRIKQALNSMSYLREIDEDNYDGAVHALSLNRRLDSLMRREYVLKN